MCIKVGIRGECSTAKIYIDDLPGINIENAADIAEGFERPSDVVDKAASLALDQVYNDWINQIKDYFDYQEVMGRITFQNSGTDYLYGDIDEEVTITLERIPDLFIATKLRSINIYSQNTITKTFEVKDKYGQIIDDFTFELTPGLNRLEFDLTSNSDFIQIVFNLSDLQIGAYNQPISTSFTKSDRCGHCICKGTCLSLYIDKPIGLDIDAQCVVDRCELVNEFISTLKVPLLYKTGINFFLAVKGTSRINAYTRNSKEQIDYFLNLWQGGTDMVTGIKTNSAYWQSLKTAADSTVSTVKSMRLKPFKYNSSTISNNLP